MSATNGRVADQDGRPAGDKPGMGLIVIGAHFDDGVGSCAGALLRAARAGRVARVLTAMSRASWGSRIKGLIKTAHRWRPGEPAWARAREDHRACAVLGAGRDELDFIDALYRRDPRGRRLYGSGAALNGAVHPFDQGLAEQLAERLYARLGAPAHWLAFPLACGNHVDHQIVSLAGSRMLDLGYPVIFYRDFFYDTGRGEALDKLGEADMRTVRLDPAELARKSAAIACYDSQILPLYGSWAAMRQAVAGREAIEHYLLPARLANEWPQPFFADRTAGAQDVAATTGHATALAGPQP